MAKELKPHIKLDDLKIGVLPNERFGKFIDYDGEEQVLLMQTCNANFTQEGLLEVKIYDSDGDKTLIGARHDCYMQPYLVKSSDVQFLDKTTLNYVK